MNPLVRELYKRAVIVGRDYPHPDGLSYVRSKWKNALKHYKPPFDERKLGKLSRGDKISNDRELLKAVAKGRFMIREMIGIIQLKKFREMNARYGRKDDDSIVQNAINELEEKAIDGK